MAVETAGSPPHRGFWGRLFGGASPDAGVVVSTLRQNGAPAPAPAASLVTTSRTASAALPSSAAQTIDQFDVLGRMRPFATSNYFKLLHGVKTESADHQLVIETLAQKMREAAVTGNTFIAEEIEQLEKLEKAWETVKKSPDFGSLTEIDRKAVHKFVGKHRLNQLALSPDGTHERKLQNIAIRQVELENAYRKLDNHFGSIFEKSRYFTNTSEGRRLKAALESTVAKAYLTAAEQLGVAIPRPTMPTPAVLARDTAPLSAQGAPRPPAPTTPALAAATTPRPAAPPTPPAAVAPPKPPAPDIKPDTPAAHRFIPPQPTEGARPIPLVAVEGTRVPGTFETRYAPKPGTKMAPLGGWYDPDHFVPPQVVEWSQQPDSTGFDLDTLHSMDATQPAPHAPSPALDAAEGHTIRDFLRTTAHAPSPTLDAAGGHTIPNFLRTIDRHTPRSDFLKHLYQPHYSKGIAKEELASRLAGGMHRHAIAHTPQISNLLQLHQQAQRALEALEVSSSYARLTHDEIASINAIRTSMLHGDMEIPVPNREPNLLKRVAATQIIADHTQQALDNAMFAFENHFYTTPQGKRWQGFVQEAAEGRYDAFLKAFPSLTTRNVVQEMLAAAKAPVATATPPAAPATVAAQAPAPAHVLSAAKAPSGAVAQAAPLPAPEGFNLGTLYRRSPEHSTVAAYVTSAANAETATEGAKYTPIPSDHALTVVTKQPAIGQDGIAAQADEAAAKIERTAEKVEKAATSSKKPWIIGSVAAGTVLLGLGAYALNRRSQPQGTFAEREQQRPAAAVGQTV